MKKFKFLWWIIFYYVFNIATVIPFYIFNINPDLLSYSVQILYSLVTNIIFACILLIAYNKDITAYFNDFKKNGFTYVKKSLKYWGIGLLIMIVCNNIISYINPNELPENELLIRQMLGAAPLLMAISTIVVAPICEEILFRKTIKDSIKNKWGFIITSGLLFGLAHIITTYTSWVDLLYVIPYGALGGAFAYAYYKTDNLFTPICLHAIHNSLLVVIYFALLS